MATLRRLAAEMEVKIIYTAASQVPVLEDMPYAHQARIDRDFNDLMKGIEL